ncbi:alpha/beta fold hydrolase [Flavobacterium pallidum]|uniref:Alpha/beta hydrolase n=1 Tax=Flavobacterium pallidum TaxID=2172098 RepID=A0A2S1SEB8_9FLAO|nr:alpha/beta fold hydrolase [Flavobacterium pallidum]AWI24725.1 alpha/beta hydrolase [Flavobacterium pallidum]
MLYSKTEGTGQPLLILHGFLGMSDNWKTLSGQYAAEGFQVHALDMRNHGRSLHSQDFTYAAMVGDIAEYIRFNNLGAVDIIGHSMGGKIAMFYATQYSDSVRKLVIADIAPRYYAPHHQDIMKALNSVDFSKKPTRQEVDDILAQYVPDFGTRQFLMKSLYWEQPGQLGFRFNLRAFNDSIDVIGEALSANAIFTKPTLFLKGEKSHYICDDDMPTIRHHFPQSEIVTIKNAGHWLHAENPKDFFESTINFLRK